MAKETTPKAEPKVPKTRRPAQRGGFMILIEIGQTANQMIGIALRAWRGWGGDTRAGAETEPAQKCSQPRPADHRSSCCAGRSGRST